MNIYLSDNAYAIKEESPKLERRSAVLLLLLLHLLCHAQATPPEI